MADKNRGRRSADDEFDDELDGERTDDDLDAELSDDDLDSDPDDEQDGEFTDDEEEDDAAAESRPARSRAAGTRTHTRARASKETRGFSPIRKINHFVREIYAELQKVIWPTRKELLTYTTVVVVFVAIMMTVVALLDVGFARSMFLIFGTDTAEE